MLIALMAGSPPRMRGKEAALQMVPSVTRITPAYAGKSGLNRILQYTGWDHPRVCGEKSPLGLLATVRLGSPPRMRGKDGWRWRCSIRCGITPAYAGKRAQIAFFKAAGRDHPRVCGEKKNTVRCCENCTGSPPRMRGKGYVTSLTRCGVGITPAYAGKSGIFTCRSTRNKDHPRVCGEKLYMPCAIAPSVGSPPRMRGKD